MAPPRAYLALHAADLLPRLEAHEREAWTADD